MYRATAPRRSSAGEGAQDKDARMRMTALAVLVPLLALLSACGDQATLPVSAGTGPNPELPPPHRTLLPTVNIAPAKGWPAGAAPTAAPGLAIAAFADALDHPRW